MLQLLEVLRTGAGSGASRDQLLRPWRRERPQARLDARPRSEPGRTQHRERIFGIDVLADPSQLAEMLVRLVERLLLGRHVGDACSWR